jgi:hypothetical protein
MEPLSKTLNLKSLLAILFLIFLCNSGMAQDSTSTSTTTKSSSSVTTETTTVEPWVWIVGAAVLIIIIVALVRGNSSRASAGTTDRVTYTKKVTREDDV